METAFSITTSDFTHFSVEATVSCNYQGSWQQLAWLSRLLGGGDIAKSPNNSCFCLSQVWFHLALASFRKLSG